MKINHVQPHKVPAWEFFNDNTEVCEVIAEDRDNPEGQVESWFIDSLRDCRKVLDIGCGSGWPGLNLAPHVGELIGIDAAPNIIEAARVNQRNRGIKNASFTTGGMDGLPYPDNEFDGIMLCGLLESMDWNDVQRMMSEVYRVASPDARITALDQDWEDFLSRNPLILRQVMTRSSGLMLRVTERTLSPGLEKATCYAVDPNSRSGNLLLAELHGKERVRTDITPDELADEDIIDVWYDECAQFNINTMQNLFVSTGFREVDVESIFVPDWDQKVLFLKAVK